MKVKVKPNRHGKWRVSNPSKSLANKMKLVRELFNMNGIELENNFVEPEVKIIDFHGNERRIALDEEKRYVFINQKFVKKGDLDYLTAMGICNFYITNYPQFLKGGTVTLVDIHQSLDVSESPFKQIAANVAVGVTSTVVTRLLINILLK